MKGRGRGVDFSRIAAGVAGPGVDTRTWISLARVDEDPDATVWDADLGWLVDVTMVGGPLDGDGPVLCRVASGGQGPGAGAHEPPRQGCLVLVAVIGGDANSECVIVGQLHDETVAAPRTVNGAVIDEAFAERTHVFAFPEEDLDAAFANARITGNLVLADAAADQPFARGSDLAGALDGLVDAVSAFLDAAVVPSGVGGSVNAAVFTAAAVSLKAAITTFKTSRSSWLSTRIKGA